MKRFLTILFLLTAFAGFSQHSATLVQIDTGTTFESPLRPLAQSNDYFNHDQTVFYPNPALSNQHGIDVYFRITAVPLGNNDYSEWDSYFALAYSRGGKVGCRIVTIDDSYGGNVVGGNKLAYPTSWHNTMQGETNPDFTIGGVWWPNYNSATYQANWAALIVAVNNHLNSTVVGGGKTQRQLLAFWDISGIGHYGEGHTSTSVGDTWTFPTGTFWTNASLQAIVNAQTAVLSDVPMIGNANFLASNSRMPSGFPSWYIAGSNAWGRFGLRFDNLGNKTIFDFEYTNNTGSEGGFNFKNEMSNWYKTAPVFAEPVQFGFSATGQCNYYDVMRQITLLHVSMIENADNIMNRQAVPTCTADIFRSAFKITAYRLTVKSYTDVDSIIPNGNYQIQSLFANTGIAPLYETFNVTYELWQSGSLKTSWPSTFIPKLFLPGQTVIVDNHIMNGTWSGLYDLYIRFTDPKGVRANLALQFTGRQADGRYLIRSGIGVATQGSTQPPPPPPPANQPPVILIGTSQSDTLPKNIDTLYAQISDPNNDNVTYTWTQSSGPNTATMGTASGTVNTSSGAVSILNRISGLIEGPYSFRLTANDGKGGIAISDMSVLVADTSTHVDPPPPPPPPPIYLSPTISTTGDTTIQYPADSVYLRGHIADTASTTVRDTTIASVQWIKFSGSGATNGTILNPTDSVTKVTGLSPGLYQYYFRVTDKAGNIVSTQAKPLIIIVKPVNYPPPIPLPGVKQPTRIFGKNKRVS